MNTFIINPLKEQKIKAVPKLRKPQIKPKRKKNLVNFFTIFFIQNLIIGPLKSFMQLLRVKLRVSNKINLIIGFIFNLIASYNSVCPYLKISILLIRPSFRNIAYFTTKQSNLLGYYLHGILINHLLYTK